MLRDRRSLRAVARRLGLLLSGLALLAATDVWGAGPSLGLSSKKKPVRKSTAVARTPIDDYQLKEVKLAITGGTFTMTIHSPAPWSQWILANPPRIVVDLGQTRTRLPNAPGLFEQKIGRGVIRAFRTSQNVSGPLDRRVRLTVELDRVLPYEVKRVGEDILVTVPNTGAKGDWDLAVVAPAEPEPKLEIGQIQSPAPTAVDLLVAAAEGRTASPARVRGPETEPPVENPPPTEELVPHDAAPTEESHAAPSLETPHAELETSPKQHGAEVNSHESEASAHATAAQPHEAELTQHEAESTPHEAQSTQHGAEPTQPEAASHSEQKPLEQERTRTPRGGETDRQRSLREALEAVVGKGNVTQTTPESPVGAPISLPPDASEEQADLDAIDKDPGAHDPALSEVGEEAPESIAVRLQALHTQSGLRLYREGLDAWLQGSATRARKALERARRYYPSSEGAARAGLLLREILVLAGDELAADKIGDPEMMPDPSWLPFEAYQRLLAGHEAKKNYLELERLYREWGPLYPRGAWCGRLDWTLGQFYLKSDRIAEARAHLEAIPDGDTYGPRALLTLAQLSEDEHDDGAALERYRYLSMLPSSAWQQRALVRAADLEFQAGSLAEALGLYEDFLGNKVPEDEEAWAIYQTGNCLFLMGDAAGARLRYEEVARRFPSSFWAPHAQERMEGLAWNLEVGKAIEATARP